MTARASTSVSAARLLLVVIALVVLSFVIATSISQYIETAIVGRTDQIISNAMPTIQTLSNSRGELRRLENHLDQYAIADPAERVALASRISAVRENLGALLASYAALPSFADEARLNAHARADFDLLEHEIEAFFVHPSPGGNATLHRPLDEFDESLQRIIAFDAAQGQRLGLEIVRIHRQTSTSAVVLDAVSVLLAIIAAILAVRQLRRAARHHAAELRAHDQREADLASRNEALGEFAGRVAHDVLSPLTAAALSLELIRQTCDDDKSIQHAIDRGSSSIARVQTLVTDLLTFSQAGGRPEPGVSVKIAHVITDLAAELSMQARQRNIDLQIGTIPDGSLACSEGVLTSLITNLVRNAIKYMDDTRERRIDLRVQSIGDRWRFEVEDTGPGIAAEQQRRIFEPYVMLDRRAAGIGLGLATVDQLVRAHGGSVGVISPPRSGRGALFWIEIPKLIEAPAVDATLATAQLPSTT